MLIGFLKNIKRRAVCLANLLYDERKYIDFYSDFPNSINQKNVYEREIMVLCHTIEKGFSHIKMKSKFGYSSAKKISDCLNEYIKLENPDNYIVSLAFSTLTLYNEKNLKLGMDVKDSITIPTINAEPKLSTGVMLSNTVEYYRNVKDSFENFCWSRKSIRLFDIKSEEISIDTVFKCVETATCSPSACNRQAVRVKIIINREKIASISKIQGGARGFGENAGAMLIITSDIRYYMSSERRLPMFDCGLFVMNLVYALHSNKIGTCILNGSLTKHQEVEMYKVITIQKYEMISSIILLAKIPEDFEFKTTNSCKKPVEDIIEVLT